MCWQLHEVILRLVSPVHIGRNKVGNVKQTYPYVHGRAFWGALTASLTRQMYQQLTAENYKKIGDRVNTGLLFSYFYPASKNESNGYDIWFPGKNDRDRIQSCRFLSSYASTALDYERNCAKEASLHEVEFISPHTGDSAGPVFMMGYIAVSDKSRLDWQTALGHMQIGSERTYGWGRVEIEEIIDGAKSLFGYEVDLSNNSTVVIKNIPKGSSLLAHTDLSVNAKGHVRPFVGRMWRNDTKEGKLGAGQKIMKQGIFWEPGSIAGSDTALQIGKFGIWEKAGE